MMMESIELIVGAGIMAFGFIAGAMTSRITQRRLRSVQAPKAICESCEDGLGYHDDDGACHALRSRTTYDESGNNIGMQQYRCPCQQYVGPLPADRMLATFLPPPNPEPPTR